MPTDSYRVPAGFAWVFREAVQVAAEKAHALAARHPEGHFIRDGSGPLEVRVDVDGPVHIHIEETSRG